MYKSIVVTGEFLQNIEHLKSWSYMLAHLILLPRVSIGQGPTCHLYRNYL